MRYSCTSSSSLLSVRHASVHPRVYRAGGKQLVIIDLTYPIIGTIRELLDIRGDIRHFSKHGFVYTVFDRKISISAINAELTRFSLDEPMKALYVEDRTYARYLTSTFETIWKQSIPAQERIQELLKQGPPEAEKLSSDVGLF